MTADYRVLVSATAAPTEFTGELNCTAISFTEELNGPGIGMVSAPLRGSGLDPSKMGAGTHCLWIESNGVLIWGGLIWTISGSVSSNSMDIGATGFHSYARRRVIATTVSFSDTDQQEIAHDLMETMELESGSLGIIGTSQAGSTGVLRDRTYYGYERRYVGTVIDQLAAVNNGFDFRYDVAYDSNGEPSVEFIVDYPSSGHQTDVVFELGTNVESAEFVKDATYATNRAHTLGAGDGNSTLIDVTDDASRRPTYPLLESVTSYPDVSRAGTLQEHGERTLGRGVETTHLTLKVTANSHTPIGSYKVGDIVRSVGDYGFFSVDGSYRITAITNTVSPADGEYSMVSLASVSAFEEWN